MPHRKARWQKRQQRSGDDDPSGEHHHVLPPQASSGRNRSPSRRIRAAAQGSRQVQTNQRRNEVLRARSVGGLGGPGERESACATRRDAERLATCGRTATGAGKVLTLSNPFACARASAGAASAVSMLQQQAPDTTALTRLGVDYTVS